MFCRKILEHYRGTRLLRKLESQGTLFCIGTRATGKLDLQENSCARKLVLQGKLCCKETSKAGKLASQKNSYCKETCVTGKLLYCRKKIRCHGKTCAASKLVSQGDLLLVNFTKSFIFILVVKKLLLMQKSWTLISWVFKNYVDRSNYQNNWINGNSEWSNQFVWKVFI